MLLTLVFAATCCNFLRASKLLWFCTVNLFLLGNEVKTAPFPMLFSLVMGMLISSTTIGDKVVSTVVMGFVVVVVDVVVVVVDFVVGKVVALVVSTGLCLRMLNRLREKLNFLGLPNLGRSVLEGALVSSC